ncbi:spindle assembly checkpoint component MAD1 [Ostrinia furnacalis]|uniref:spindle assembly checkpoint component MAD1 n=1 Tax=Ostrinia furnacalis TaxID=93504 RepID=UPI00103A66B9|nr:spindle assembly checkpoint component MAD1 [Ostrinia furnacalis]
MFITLLLVAPALCEWVEISQHHVRKPTRPHHFRPVETATESFEKTTKETKIYPNQSLTEHPWSRGNVNKVPKIGSVQRVQLDSSPIKAPSLTVNPVKNTLNEENIKPANKNYASESVSHTDLMEIQQHKINSVPESERHNPSYKHSVSNIEKLNFQNSKQIFQENKNKDERTSTILNNRKKGPSHELDRVSFSKPVSKNQNTDDIQDDFKFPVVKRNNNVTLRPHLTDFSSNKGNRNSLFTSETGEHKEHDEISDTRRNDIHKFKLSNSGIQSEKGTTENVSQRNKLAQNSNANTRVKFPGTDDNLDRHGSFIKTKLPNSEYVNEKLEDDDNDATVADESEDPNSSGTEDFNSDESNSGPETEASNNSKANSLQNLMTFMKVVADTIRKNTRRSVSSKTRYLTNLKNTILANIAERIDTAWPDDESVHSRQRRAAASPRGHVEIPSSESALMTISFLTFAVFLIKLVLQVIQTYKNKAMMVSPAVVAVGRAVAKRIAKP